MQKIIQNYPTYALVFVFGLVYALSLTFIFIEGDDAFTVAYHVYGRNLVYQGPYSPYHGMMDVFFSFFPPSESILRVVAIGVSSIAAISFVVLLGRLVMKWLPKELSANLVYFIPLLPFIVPELFFFGLIYMPSIVAISFMLGGHLLIRKQFENSKIKLFPFLLALVFFGLGAACRWDTAVYGIVIFMDVLTLLISQKSMNVKRVTTLLIWCVLAIASVLLFIYFSGYSPIDIKDTLVWAKKYLSAKPPSMLKKLALIISLLTPAFIICFFIGVVRLIYEKRWGLLMLGIAGYLPKLYLGLTLLPKSMVMALPGFFLICYIGFDYLLKLEKPKFRLAGNKVSLISALLVMTIAIPWVVGIHINAGNTSWGPGFEVSYKPVALEATKGSLDNKISLGKIRPSISGGFAVPTPEGPRPVWGFASVLLGGGWRGMLQQHHQSIEEVIEQAKKEKIPILQNNKFMLVMTNIMGQGFKQANVAENLNSYEHRQFVLDLNNEFIDVFMIRNKVMFKKDEFEATLATIQRKKFICWFISSSDIAKLKETYPGHVKIISPFSAILDLETK